jgi:hypothetical protein
MITRWLSSTDANKSMPVYAWCGDTYDIRPKSPLLTLQSETDDIISQ